MAGTQNGDMGVRKPIFHEFFNGQPLRIGEYEPTGQRVSRVLYSVTSEVKNGCLRELLEDTLDRGVLAFKIWLIGVT